MKNSIVKELEEEGYRLTGAVFNSMYTASVSYEQLWKLSFEIG